MPTGIANIAIGYDSVVGSDVIDVIPMFIPQTLFNFITSFRCPVGLTVTSDISLKKEIKTIPLGLGFINKLHPVEYYRNNNPTSKEWGLLSQELQEAINNIGYKNAGT